MSADKRPHVRDLHGNAPDKAETALLLIDVINDLEFPTGPQLQRSAMAAARRLRELKQRAKRAGVPCIYVNDNFGRWRSDFSAQVKHCLRDGTRGAPLVALLRPEADDYFVLKPKHSGATRYERSRQRARPSRGLGAHAQRTARRDALVARSNLRAGRSLAAPLHAPSACAVAIMTLLRLISWNVENLPPALGIAPKAKPRSHARVRAHLYEILEQLGKPDVLCLQEVRIRPGDAPEVAAMRSALPGYACHYALCRDPWNAKFRGGRAHGVATYLRTGLRAVPIPLPAWDLALLIVNVYAVNGTDRPYFDPQTGEPSGDRHAFKRRFQAELISYLREIRAEQRLVLLGDWNISRERLDTWPRLRTEPPHALARAMFNDTLMPALDVVDAFRELHPEQRAFTWFNRAARPGTLDAARVDFALVSRALLPEVREATILDEPTQRFHSDHAPVGLVLTASAPQR
jgi:exodeoxyribonuclease-3